MTDKELIRRALMGSQEAQQACTDKGILPSCPLCKGVGTLHSVNSLKSICAVCQSCGIMTRGYKEAKEAIKQWNTRPASPVGKCKDCVWSREPTEEDYKELDRELLSYKDSLVCDFWEREVWDKDFCSYFDEKEELPCISNSTPR